mmetsp:Transcript_73734/g.204259  ORF Transcript_73734/g.204259 Transcript_73734/m.204259 type:complete len:259 (-) Transcript_73734:91-867(-)
MARDRPSAQAKGKAEGKGKGGPAAEAQAAGWKKKVREPADQDAVVKRLDDCKVVPVIRIERVEDAVPLCRALLDGGIDLAEITFRTDCAAEAIRAVCQSVEGMCVGAGTVVDPQQVDAAIDNGADFVVSPGFDARVARRCAARGALYLPGTITPTEVMTAMSYGLRHLKFAPATTCGGLGALKSYGAVFPDVAWMPTGGVTEANIIDFVTLPNVVASGGTWMVGEAAIRSAAASGDWSAIVDAARKARAAAHGEAPPQ